MPTYFLRKKDWKVFQMSVLERYQFFSVINVFLFIFNFSMSFCKDYLELSCSHSVASMVC